MAVLEIALIIGTSQTSIYLSGSGVVLKEPTVVAFSDDRRRLRAVGREAVEMLGKTPEHTVIVSPVSEGVIADPGAAGVLVSEFVRRVIPDRYIFKPRIRAVVGLPMGLDEEERRMYENVCFRAGINEISFEENIMLTAVGVEMPVDEPTASMVVNIGGGISEIAVVSLCGIVDGCGVTIGGNMMDNAVIDSFIGKYNLRIGTNTARRLKHDIGSLYSNDSSSAEVKGVDVRTKRPVSETAYAADLQSVLEPYYERICDAAENIINGLKPELAGDVYRTGICLAGGGSQITGLPELFSERLHLPVYLAEEPEYAAILGAGKLLSDAALRRELIG